jgi:glycosyltransferase involved in cell wall biosynthesis
MPTTPAPTPEPPAPVAVTAVVVAHDGGRWLPALVAAVTAQDRPPDVVVAADTGSTDDSAGRLVDWLGQDAVASCDRDAGFGSAVAAALQARPAASADPDWLWLLHDDCVPEPGALAALLAEVARDPSVGIAGPKVRALGADAGLLSVVSVLASLYPVLTVVLARAMLGERLIPVQAAGVTVALAGVALIATG